MPPERPQSGDIAVLCFVISAAVVSYAAVVSLGVCIWGWFAG